jgi:hypothetical protein
VFWKNESGKLTRVELPSFGHSTGLWQTLEVCDTDNDGDQDFVAGNFGLNNRYAATSKLPLRLYITDFFHDGMAEVHPARQVNGKFFPLRHVQVYESLTKNFINRYSGYMHYAAMELIEVIGSAERILEAASLETSVFLNIGNGNFSVLPLPWQAQLSSVHAVLCADLNSDSLKDFILAGNDTDMPWDIGDNDAAQGVVLINSGNGKFQYIPVTESGLRFSGAVRKLIITKTSGNTFLISANADGELQFFKFNPGSVPSTMQQ